YAAVADGRVDIERLRTALAGVPLPRAADGRVLAVDITCWLRPDVHTSPERILCHTYGRGKDQHIMIPCWPYSMVAALEPGRSSERRRPGAHARTPTPRRATAASSSLATRAPGVRPPSRHRPTLASTAPPPRWRGIGCTRD